VARVMVVGDAERANIKRVVGHALAHPFSRHLMIRIIEQVDLPAGERPGFSCSIPDGFRCVFTIEEHPLGWCRHLSVSACDPGRVPSIEAMQFMLMPEFGFWGPLQQEAGQRFIQLGDDPVQYVEVIEKMKPGTEPKS
jgi:hypothetical protein